MTRRRSPMLLALLCALALLGAACGEDQPEGDSPTAGASPTGGIPEFETIEEGVLKVGSCLDYPPFESIENGDEVGFDVDVIEEIASRLDLEVEWITADFDTIFTAVDTQQFDVAAAAITATGPDGEERDQTVDFTDFYYNSRQAVAVNVNETPDVESLEDLEPGDVVGVQRGTTGASYAEENVPEGVEIRTYPEGPASLRDLEAGQVQAAVNDEPFTAEFIQDLEGVEIVDTPDTNEKYAFAVSEENPGLRDAISAAFQEIVADGTYEEIFGTYFPGVEVPEEFRAAE